EGVQPQTRVLMRALSRLRIPTLIFVNKLDRVGADFDRVLRDVAERLTPKAVHPDADPDSVVEILAVHDEALLAAYLEEAVPAERLRTAFVEQARQALVYPVFGGSAVTGAGVHALVVALGDFLPASAGDPGADLSAVVFKMRGGGGGEKTR